MYMVTAFIKAFKLEDVRAALLEIGVLGMSVSEVKGYGRQKGITEHYRGAEYNVDFVSKLRLEIAISAEILPRVLDAIKDSAHTGKIGDGKIFVHELKEAIRIRTGEVGPDVL